MGTLKNFVENWDNNVYDNTRKSMIEAGWYDWFCTDKSLYKTIKRKEKV